MKFSKIFISLLNRKIKVLPFLILVAFIVYTDKKNEKRSQRIRQVEKELATEQAQVLKKELELEYRIKEVELRVKQEFINQKLADLELKNDLLFEKQQTIKKHLSLVEADKELRHIITEVGNKPNDLYGNAHRVMLFNAIAKQHGLEDIYYDFRLHAQKDIMNPYTYQNQFNTVTNKD